MQVDLKGQQIFPGDIVLVPCVITVVKSTVTGCELALATVATGANPEQSIPHTWAATQVIRANRNDPVDYFALLAR